MLQPLTASGSGSNTLSHSGLTNVNTRNLMIKLLLDWKGKAAAGRRLETIVVDIIMIPGSLVLIRFNYSPRTTVNKFWLDEMSYHRLIGES